MALEGKTIDQISYFEFLIAIVLGWILVALWQRAIDNFTFRTLGLSPESTFHTFLIAALFTAIFLLYVFTFSTGSGDLVETDSLGPIEPVESDQDLMIKKMKGKKDLSEKITKP